MEGGAKSSTVPKYVDAVDDLFLCSVSAGYGHVCYVVRDRGRSEAATAKYTAFPTLGDEGTGTGTGTGKGGQKRKRDE